MLQLRSELSSLLTYATLRRSKAILGAYNRGRR